MPETPGTSGRVLTPEPARRLDLGMTNNDENQFIAARAWLLTYADEYGVEYRLTGKKEVRVWRPNAPFPLYVYLDGKEWVLNTGPRFQYLHRAVMHMLTDAMNTLMGTQYHLDAFGEPCWSGCPC